MGLVLSISSAILCSMFPIFIDLFSNFTDIDLGLCDRWFSWLENIFSKSVNFVLFTWLIDSDWMVICLLFFGFNFIYFHFSDLRLQLEFDLDDDLFWEYKLFWEFSRWNICLFSLLIFRNWVALWFCLEWRLFYFLLFCVTSCSLRSNYDAWILFLWKYACGWLEIEVFGLQISFLCCAL